MPARLVERNQLHPVIGWESSWLQLPAAVQGLRERSFPGKAIFVVDTG